MKKFSNAHTEMVHGHLIIDKTRMRSAPPIVLLLLLAVEILAATHGLGADLSRDATKVRLEKMAQTCRYFSPEVIINNRSLAIGPVPVLGPGGIENPLPEVPIPIVQEQYDLAKDLRALGSNRASLARLLRHSDPRVRTLALAAIFEREDGRDLPLIATLANDDAQTFPCLHESMDPVARPHPMSELVSPLTVGQVAKSMLWFWMNPDHGSNETFSEYWKRYGKRNYHASWFAVKMNRATRETIPIRPEYRKDIQRVVDQMNALPSPDREWTQLYVLCPPYPDLGQEAIGVSNQELVAVAKRLGPEALLRFLERKPISDDTDLDMSSDKNPKFAPIGDFLLWHADQLLRPKDADALLACSQRETKHDRPIWIVGRARLLPAQAANILQKALTDERAKYAGVEDELTGAMWRICGPTAKDFLADWFYSTLAAGYDPFDKACGFLRQVQDAARPDTRQLLVALVKDPRFEMTDWTALSEMLKLANVGRPTPLVSEQEIYDSEPQSQTDQKSVLLKWHTLLRHEYGVGGA